MIECKICSNFMVKFDNDLKRPLCHNCGWFSKTMPSPVVGHLYELCDECWGYQELRIKDVCSKCCNEGKILNSLGKEIVDLVKEVIELDG